MRSRERVPMEISRLFVELRGNLCFLQSVFLCTKVIFTLKDFTLTKVCAPSSLLNGRDMISRRRNNGGGGGERLRLQRRLCTLSPL